MNDQRRKRRFFDEDVEMSSPRRIPRVEMAMEDAIDEPMRSPSPQPMWTSPVRPSPAPQHEQATSKQSADNKLQQFRAIVGKDVSDAALLRLLTMSKGNLEEAINVYFSQPIAERSSATTSRPARTDIKYIGESYVQGWSTVSGTDIVKEGDVVKIERSKQAANAPPSYRRNRASGTRRVAENVLVRFSTLEGREVGRLHASEAKTIARLMDLEVCIFEARITLCPSCLKTANDILLHVKCYFTEKAFSAMEESRNLEDRPAFDRAAESQHERLSQERTLAILDLLKKVNLKPARSAMQRMNIKVGVNDDEARDRITQTLQAAQAAQGRAGEPEEEQGEDEPEEKEVTDEQLDTIYEKAQMYDNMIMPMNEPPELALTLKPYQKRALGWMAHKESLQHDQDDVDMRAMHPLWEEYQFVDDPDGSTLNEAMFFYFNPYTGQLSLEFPELESAERGGILADEMGLGKTIEILSLIHQNKFVPGATPAPSDKESCSPTTLVVCPMSLLAQWRDELIRGSQLGSIRVQVYYGDNRDGNIREKLCRWDGSAPDVLVTTYGIVMNEWSRSLDLLSSINFWRVVLDEAHHIKNRISKTSRACTALRSPRRWAVTGTPIQNKLEDLYALVRFLRHEPWGNYTFWRTFVTIPFEKKDPRALAAVKEVLQPIVIRRTKNMKDLNGNPMVPLPPKEVNIEYLRFSEQEQDIYDSLYTDSRTKFSHFCAAGKALSHYASIFQLLTRLRQVTCHPYLVLSSSENEKEIQTKDGGITSLKELMERYRNTDNAYGANVLEQLFAQEQGEAKDADDRISEECPLCLETFDTKVILPTCGHMYCRECIMGYLQGKEDAGLPGECPSCRKEVRVADLFELTASAEDTVDSPGSSYKMKIDVRQAVGGYQSSTKVDAFLDHIRKYLREGHKTVVFSQFTRFLDILEMALKREDVQYTRLDGKQSQSQRENVLAKFSDKQSKIDVLLISLRAGGVGLNLTCASRVLVMDPWWNLAVEAQAIDRVHRLGQDNPVVVTRFIVEGTVEERILAIQNKKHALANQLYMSKEDSRNEKLNDLQILFGTRPIHNTSPSTSTSASALIDSA
ncbi:SNF2 family N-terminal domain-containing protein [Fennellomyces sp. T-0311]|nr:SNF2 family N-terminal domain-containing protein [Fennellomyces sp. T-0311]